MSDLQLLQQSIMDELNKLPANTSSVQIFLYGFSVNSEDLTEKTSTIFEHEILCNINYNTKLELLQNCVSSFLVNATTLDTKLKEVSLTEEDSEPLLAEIKIQLQTMRNNLNEFANDLETRPIIRSILIDINNTLIQACAPQSWTLVNSFFSNKKFPQLRELFLDVQWEASQNKGKQGTQQVKKPLVSGQQCKSSTQDKNITTDKNQTTKETK